MQIDPRKLIQFAEIVEHRSFSIAAERLGTTQPGLSKMVALLEERLKARLLAQRRRPVVPTELGRQLAEIGAVLRMATMTASALAADSARGAVGHLRIGAPPFICDGVLAEIILSFQERHRGVKFDIVPAYGDELRRLVHGNQLDIAWGPILLQQDDLRLATSGVITTRHAIVCGPGNPLRSRATLSASAFEKAEWISHSDKSALYDVMRGCLTGIGLSKITPNVVSESAGAILTMLRRTDRLTILPAFSIIDLLESDDLATLPIRLQEPNVMFGAVTHAMLPSGPIARAFSKHSQAAFRRLEQRVEAYFNRGP